jgi:hypothetical protein
MLSVILLAYDTTLHAPARDGAQLRESVVRSLSSLVDGAIQGLIADAVLAGPRDAALGAIADEAGCDLVEDNAPVGGLLAALARVRHEDVFLFTAGHAVERGFIEEARDVAAFGGLGRARLLRAAPDSVLTRFAPNLARPVGLLARKEVLVESATVELPLLARRLRCADLTARARKCR